ncbi:MAG: hypothetical protein RO009_02095 [Pseudorhodoplanes sp.]|jgi:hypothetical protein|nr:hypothetical protein [Pseudorhodoplanes sp.]
MSKRQFAVMTIALTSCAFIAMHGVASAQSTKAQNTKPKKVTYEQAWKLCKQALSKESHSILDTNTRYLRGGACMAKYGYSF